MLVSLGCELGRDVDAEFVQTLDDAVRGSAAGMLLCDNSGSGEAYGAQTADASDFYDYHFYADPHYFDPLVDHFRRDWREQRPWIFGEFCDADDYRDLDAVRSAYRGRLPWWLTEQHPIHTRKLGYHEQEARMARLKLPYSHAELQAISRRQSLMVRKTILEKVRARSGMGGYVITSIRQTGLAASSLFDDLMQPKYDAGTFTQFNADSVLLLGQARARAWVRGGDRPRRRDAANHLCGQPVAFSVLLAHVGPRLRGGDLSWQAVDDAGDSVGYGQQTLSGALPLETRRPSARSSSFRRCARTFTASHSMSSCKAAATTSRTSGRCGSIRRSRPGRTTWASSIRAGRWPGWTTCTPPRRICRAPRRRSPGRAAC